MNWLMLTLETQNLHPSTLLSLEALQALPDDFQPKRVLDLGCGNGILSIVAAELWPEAEITAVDISENAVRDARAAIRERKLEKRVFVHQDDAFRYLNGAFCHSEGAFCLIIANLLADIVIPCAPGIKKNLNSAGYAILSGLLAWKCPAVELTYNDLEFDFIEQFDDSPWRAYTLCHKTET